MDVSTRSYAVTLLAGVPDREPRADRLGRYRRIWGSAPNHAGTKKPEYVDSGPRGTAAVSDLLSQEHVARMLDGLRHGALMLG